MAEQPQQQMQVTPLKTTTIQQFGVASVEPIENGMALTFLHGDGELVTYPIAQEVAEEVGKKLLAPRVHTARSVAEANGQGV